MAKKKRSPVKKTTSKKAPGKKKAAKKAPAKKKATAKTSAEPTPEPTPEPTSEPPPDDGKKKQPKKRRTKESDRKDFLEAGLIEFNAGEDLRKRFQNIHEALGSDDVLMTMTAVFEAGLQELESTLKPAASGNLIEIEEGEEGTDDEPYGEDFDEAFGQQVLGRMGV